MTEKEALENIKEAITAWLWAEDQKAVSQIPQDAARTPIVVSVSLEDKQTLINRRIQEKPMSRRFTAIITREKDWYVAHCVELGVVSQGKSIEEAQSSLNASTKEGKTVTC